jgi:hypothetical protein
MAVLIAETQVKLKNTMQVPAELVDMSNSIPVDMASMIGDLKKSVASQRVHANDILSKAKEVE